MIKTYAGQLFVCVISGCTKVVVVVILYLQVRSRLEVVLAMDLFGHGVWVSVHSDSRRNSSTWNDINCEECQ